MGTIETVLLILNAIRSEIETMRDNSASPDFISAYDDCIRVVNDAQDGFLDGITGR
jgi:hypothetical protein